MEVDFDKAENIYYCPENGPLKNFKSEMIGDFYLNHLRIKMVLTTGIVNIPIL